MVKNPIEETSKLLQAGRKKILVVGERGYFSQKLISHSVQIAGRLHYDIMALSIDTQWEGENLGPKAAQSVKALMREATGSSIRCDHLVRSGELGSEVEDIIHETKRLEFVVVDGETNREELREITIPIVSVSCGTPECRGGQDMSEESHRTTKSTVIAKTAGYGLLSAGLYTALFTNSDTVMHYFTKGGVFAALPIITVFVFSFAHSVFAHNLWSLLGIEAIRKDRVRQTERKVIEKRKTQRKRPRQYAYVNPFHRIDR